MHPAKRELWWLASGVLVLVVATAVEIARPCDPTDGPCSQWRQLATPVRQEIPATLYSVWASDKKPTLWVGGENQFLAHSEDGGKTWAETRLRPSAISPPVPPQRVCGDRPPGQDDDVIGLGFLGEQGVAITRTRRFTTTDGGKRWNEAPHAYSGGLQDDLRPLNAANVRGAEVKHIVTCDGRVFEVSGADVRPLLDGEGAIAYFESRGTPGGPSRLVSALLKEDHSVVFRKDGQRRQSPLFKMKATSVHASFTGTIWVTFEDGAIVWSNDGGRTWNVGRRSGSSQLNAAMFLEDSRSGWAAGALGVVLRTTDGGANWTHLTAEPGLVPPERWLKFSLWYAGGMVISALMIFTPLWSRWLRAKNRTSRAREVLSSDRPVQSDQEENLGFRPLANAIAKLLLNRHTSYPLVAAIQGKWGSGKTSIARLVQARARQSGMRVVWFDVWHHAEEEDLLAALFDTIRCTGIPRPWKPAGILFRLGVAVRGVWQMLPLFLLIVGAAWIWSHAGPVFATLTTLFTILGVDALQGLPDTNNFMSRLSRAIGLPDPDLRLGPRHRFATALRKITDALVPGSRLLVIVDDLDRCSKDTIQQTIASINFLTTSVECAFLIAMDRERIERVLGEETARELIDKFVDMAIGVPQYTQRDVFDAAWRARSTEDAGRIARWSGLRLVVLAALMLAGYAAFDQRTSVRKIWPSWTAQSVAAKPNTPVAAAAALPRNDTAPAVFPNAVKPAGTQASWLVPISMALIALMAWFILRRSEQTDVTDTPEFRDALEKQSKSVLAMHNTPRVMKRFMNNVRFELAYQEAKVQEAKVHELPPPQASALDDIVAEVARRIIAVAGRADSPREGAPEQNDA